jgi:acyl-CoA synthetase (AMP-forming)/AMP-acid ligase II
VTQVLKNARDCPTVVVYSEADYGGGLSGLGAPAVLGVRTLADLGRTVRGTAAGLVAAGIAPQVATWPGVAATAARTDIGIGAVAVVMPNHVDYAGIVHGCALARLAVSPCNPVYTPEEIARQLSLSGAKAVFTTREMLPKILDALKVMSVIPHRL